MLFTKTKKGEKCYSPKKYWITRLIALAIVIVLVTIYVIVNPDYKPPKEIQGIVKEVTYQRSFVNISFSDGRTISLIAWKPHSFQTGKMTKINYGSAVDDREINSVKIIN